MSAETVLSVLFGGLITLVVSWVFYKRAGDQLRDESRGLRIRAERLQRSVNVLGRAMAEAGWVEVILDKDGNVTSIAFKRGLSGTQPASSGTLTWTKTSGEAPDE